MVQGLGFESDLEAAKRCLFEGQGFIRIVLPTFG